MARTFFTPCDSRQHSESKVVIILKANPEKACRTMGSVVKKLDSLCARDGRL